MRTSRPWFNTDKNAWFTFHQGKKKRLGPHPPGANPPRKSPKTGLWNAPDSIVKALADLLGEPSSKGKELTVAVLCDQFLTYAETHNTPADFDSYKSFLQQLCNVFGKKKAVDLLPSDVMDWLQTKTTWKGARRHAIIAVKRAFNWGAEQRLLPAGLLKGLKNTRAKSSARFLLPGQREKILSTISDWQFRYFVEAMQESGCRPSEIARVTAADVDLERGLWQLKKHKNATKTGKIRTVYLTPRLFEITKELIAKNPEGALFRGPRSNKPFRLHGIITRFRRLREKLKAAYPGEDFGNICSYAYRHSVASQALKNGVPITQTAELLGTSPEMIFLHYSHIADDVEHMREAARKATA